MRRSGTPRGRRATGRVRLGGPPSASRSCSAAAARAAAVDHAEADGAGPAGGAAAAARTSDRPGTCRRRVELTPAAGDVDAQVLRRDGAAARRRGGSGGILAARAAERASPRRASAAAGHGHRGGDRAPRGAVAPGALARGRRGVRRSAPSARVGVGARGSRGGPAACVARLGRLAAARRRAVRAIGSVASTAGSAPAGARSAPSSPAARRRGGPGSAASAAAAPAAARRRSRPRRGRRLGRRGAGPAPVGDRRRAGARGTAVASRLGGGGERHRRRRGGRPRRPARRAARRRAPTAVAWRSAGALARPRASTASTAPGSSAARRRGGRRLGHVRVEDGGLGRPRERRRPDSTRTRPRRARRCRSRAPACRRRSARRDVVERPHELPGAGVARVARALREPEVGEVGVVPAPDEDVLRLHVAVDQAGLVRGVERVGDGEQDRDRALRRRARRAHDSRLRSVPRTSRIAMNSPPSNSPAS